MNRTIKYVYDVMLSLLSSYSLWFTVAMPRVCNHHHLCWKNNFNLYAKYFVFFSCHSCADGSTSNTYSLSSSLSLCMSLHLRHNQQYTVESFVIAKTDSVFPPIHIDTILCFSIVVISPISPTTPSNMPHYVQKWRPHSHDNALRRNSRVQ